jgi:hypothetical protein
MTKFVGVLAVLGALTTLTACGSASQRSAIEHAVRTNQASAADTRQVFTEVRVSTVDPSYAIARTNDTASYAGTQTGTKWILRRSPTGWHVVFVGSSGPPCHVAPKAVRKDLLSYTVCSEANNASPVADHSRNPTYKEREAITALLPRWLKRYPIGCLYVVIRVSSDGRYARLGVGFLNALHDPCIRYAFNGPDWIAKETHSHWKVIGYTGAVVGRPCAPGIPTYLLIGRCSASKH